MKKEFDPRLTKCPVSLSQNHKWARAFKDTISKTQFVHILRCRYCADYVAVEFNRVILPSGKVAIDQRPFEIVNELVTPELRIGNKYGKETKRLDFEIRTKGGTGEPLALVASATPPTAEIAGNEIDSKEKKDGLK